jgi:predicted transposase YbfD/YdcC
MTKGTRGRQKYLNVSNIDRQKSWAAEARMCLAQRKAPGRNEAAGALEVLGLLDLEGCIVTADALHCHRDFATTVLDRGADYVLALKENQSKLFAAAVRRYARSGARNVAERREPVTHDRCEWRRATVLRDTSFAAVRKFPGVLALARRCPCGASPGALLPALRIYSRQAVAAHRALHWGIENQLHWVLDVVFNEDRNRTRKDNAPENLAILRKLAVNVVRSHPAATSLRQKIKRAGWDDTFLLGMLGHMR